MRRRQVLAPGPTKIFQSAPCLRHFAQLLPPPAARAGRDRDAALLSAADAALLSAGAPHDDVQLTTALGFHGSAPVYSLLPVLDWWVLVEREWRL